MENTKNTNNETTPETSTSTQIEFLAIPVETAQQFMNYLSDRPFKEVYQLVNVLGSLQPINIVQNVPKADDTKLASRSKRNVAKKDKQDETA